MSRSGRNTERAVCRFILTCITHTPIESTTARRVRARGLQSRNRRPCRPRALTRRSGWTTLSQLLFFLKEVSCCERAQLLHIGLSGREQKGDEFAALGTQQVAMGTGHLSDEPVGSEQAELAADRGASAVGLFFGTSGQWIEVFSEIGVAEAVDGPFASADYFQKRGLGLAERVQASKAIPILVNWLTEFSDGGSERFNAPGARQGLQVTAVGRAADFGAARHIRDTASEALPAAWGLIGLGCHAAIGSNNRLGAHAGGLAGRGSAGVGRA